MRDSSEDLPSLVTHPLPSTIGNAATDRRTREPCDDGRPAMSSIDSDHDGSSFPSAPGNAAPRYEIIAPHASGGLGEVFLARDNELDREIALKVVQPRHAHRPDAHRRFDFEAKVTSLLEHPGIVPIYGIGKLSDGRTCYAMRFIRGESMSDAIARFHRRKSASGTDEKSSKQRDANAASRHIVPDFTSLEFRNLLRSFIDACNAVAYAHSRGVIHRDIKPANIMLGKFGETHVVDWGLARPFQAKSALTDTTKGPIRRSDSTEDEPGTQQGSAVGTPAYMSPEQASGELDRLSPATDVFSLGATLFEILTGQPPYSSNSGKSPIDRAVAVEHSAPRTLQSSIPHPLEAICKEAMSASSFDRYPSPEALAADLERYLADEPITARREPLVGRSRRWVRKHPGGVGGVAAAVLVGLASLAVGLGVVSQKNRQLGFANTELSDKNTELKASNAKETAATALTAERLKQIELINNTVFDIFAEFDIRKIQLGSDPVEQVLAQKLVEAGKKLDAKAIHDPKVLAKLQGRLGKTLIGLGEMSFSLKLLEAVLRYFEAAQGANDHESLVAANELGMAYLEAGQHDKALPLLEGSLRRRRAKYGAKHPMTIAAIHNSALGYHAAGQPEKALGLQKEVVRLQISRFGSNDRDTISAKLGLGTTLSGAGRYSEALPLMKEALQWRESNLGADHPDTIQNMCTLAKSYCEAGMHDKSLSLLIEANRLSTAKLGAEHPISMNAAGQLGILYRESGKVDVAIPVFETILRNRRSKLGANHPQTLQSMTDLALAYLDLRQFDAAQPLFEESLRLRKAKLGNDHPDAMASMNELAGCFRAAGKIDAALPLLDELYRMMKAKRGIGHPHTLTAMRNLATACLDAGQVNRALTLNEEAMSRTEALLGPEHTHTLISKNNLAVAYKAAGQPDRALPLLESVLRYMNKSLGPDHPNVLQCMNNLGDAYLKVGRTKEALQHQEAASKGFEKRGFRDRFARNAVRSTFAAYERLGEFERSDRWRMKLIEATRQQNGPKSWDESVELAIWGRDLLIRSQWIDAETKLRECHAIQASMRPDDWSTFNAKSMLGGALLGQRKFGEAEPLLLAGFGGMASRSNAMPKVSGPLILEAIDRLIEYYSATGKPEEVKKWRRERGKYVPATNPARSSAGN